MAIGDSFGQLQATRSRRNEFDVNSYFRALDEARAQAQLQEQMAQRDFANAANVRDFGANNYFKSIDIARANEDRRYNRGFREKEFKANEDYRKNQLDWHLDENRIDREKLALAPLADTLALAEEEAASGMFDPAKYISVLPPVRIQQLTSLNARSRIAPTEESNYFKSVAGTRNQDDQLAREIGSLQEFQKTAPGRRGTTISALAAVTPALRFLLPDGPTKEDAQAQIDALALERGAFKPILDRFSADKRAEFGLTKDPATGEWRPTSGLPWENAFFSAAPETAPQRVAVPQAAEVIRYTKDGRAAVYDAATKRFLRYAN